jgi:hypothetical protein
MTAPQDLTPVIAEYKSKKIYPVPAQGTRPVFDPPHLPPGQRVLFDKAQADLLRLMQHDPDHFEVTITLDLAQDPRAEMGMVYVSIVAMKDNVVKQARRPIILLAPPKTGFGAGEAHTKPEDVIWAYDTMMPHLINACVCWQASERYIASGAEQVLPPTT